MPVRLGAAIWTNQNAPITGGSAPAGAPPRGSAPRSPWCSRGGRRPRRAACPAGDLQLAGRGAALGDGGCHIRAAAASRSRSDSARTSVLAPAARDGERSRSTRASRKRSTVSRKLLQWNWVWKPRMLLPSSPSSSSSRHGQMAKRLGVGPGDVPEGDDGRARQPLADHARQRARSGSPAPGRWGRSLPPPRPRRRRSCGSPLTYCSQSLGAEDRVGRARCGRAARAPRWRSRSSSPAPLPWRARPAQV